MKPEQQIQKSILEWLAVEKIWHMRMNTGAMLGEHKGKKWMVRFGRKGCADILALITVCGLGEGIAAVLWLEVKAPKGKQSEAQHEFQKEVEAEGHRYAIVQSIEDVQDAVNAL